MIIKVQIITSNRILFFFSVQSSVPCRIVFESIEVTTISQTIIMAEPTILNKLYPPTRSSAVARPTNKDGSQNFS